MRQSISWESTGFVIRRMKISTRRVTIVLVIVAAFLRLYRLDHYPLPMHQDELSDAYDAYSIAETGADRTGARYPVVLRALGEVDYRPALYAWLAAVPIKLAGFSPYAARLPSALLGVLALLLMFLFAKRLVNESFALIALTFAVFSPWHLTYSRLAHQGAMLPAFFTILVLWLWQRSALRAYPAAAISGIGFILGLSSSAYQTTRLLGPLMLLLIAWDLFRHSSRRNIVLLAAFAAVGAAPQIFTLVTAPEHFFARLVSTLPDATPQTPSMTVSAAKGLALLFGPRLLFWPNMEDSGYLAARLLLVELPFYYIGLVTLLSVQPMKLKRFRIYLYAVFVMAALPAVITGNSSSIRVTAALPIVSLFTAAGVVWVVDTLRKWSVPTRLSYGLIGAGFVASVAFTGYMYFGSATVNGVRSNNVLVQIGERLRTLRPSYDKVFVVDSPEYSGLHVAAFAGMKPREFQKTSKIKVDAYGWDYITAVGNFHFLAPRELPLILREACGQVTRELFVTPTLIAGSHPFDSVSWHNEKYYFTDLRNTATCSQ